jgi:alanyl aminopeptidase
VVAVSATPAPAAPTPPSGLRLPEGVRPTGYQVELSVVPGEERFSGVVTATLTLSAAREVIWLHAKALDVREASFVVSGETIAARAVASGKELLAVLPARPLAAGTATLRLTFSGPLSKKDTQGLFQLSEGADWYAYTQFEAIDARRAFPCFDEPGFKVPWQLTLHVKKEHLAFANSPVESERDEPDGMKAVVFAKTLPLPSYLVAFAVGPFEIREAGRWGQKKTPVRIVVPRGKLADAQWAAESSGPILEELERYFGIPYPYDKLDQLAEPQDTGAMENPGLITYGHQLILRRPADDTPGRQRSFAGVCAHEMAHLWFGDLVTMSFWDELWLNEAFATWMSSKTIERWRPAWDAQVSRAASRGSALGGDGLINARKIRQPIQSEDDIANAFDGITYGKGSAVISMFEAYAGPDAFQRGVRRYLGEHQHGNADSTAFLAAVTAEAGRELAGPFSSFLDQAGAPRIGMELRCPTKEKKDASPPKLRLTQRRQLPVGSKGEAQQLWQVPICVRWSAKGEEQRACTLLTGAEGELQLTGARACPDWLLPNDGATGYYRASLTGALDLTTSLRRAGDKLTVAERVGLLDDLAALATAGDLDLATALEALPLALAGENRHLVGAALRLVGPLHGGMVPLALEPAWEAAVRAQFGPLARKLGFAVGANDDEERRLLRAPLLRAVGVDGKDPALRTEALRLATAWLHDRSAVHPDLVDVALAVAADTDDAALHAALLAAVVQEKDRISRGRMIEALAKFPGQARIEANFALLLSKALPVQEAQFLVWGPAGSPRTRDLAIAFVQEHWDWMVANLPADAGATLPWVAGGTCDGVHRDQVKAFFDGRSTRYTGGPRELALLLEAIDLCIAYRARHQPGVVRWLEQGRR